MIKNLNVDLSNIDEAKSQDAISWKVDIADDIETIIGNNT